MTDAFDERRRSLEEEFFYRHNQALLARLREKVKTEEGRKRLASVLGVTDQNMLDELLQAGISAETVTALMLVPLVHVAWADRLVELEERKAILRAAHDAGLADDSTSHELLSKWLHEKPSPTLLAAWKLYVGTLDASTRQQLAADIMKRCTSVARAAGGLLGLGGVSAREQAALDEIQAAFDSAG